MTARRPEHEAVAIMAAVGYATSVPYPGQGKPWPGVCLKCGNPGSSSVVNVLQGRGACRYCGHSRVDDAIAFGKLLARDFLPSVPYPGNQVPWPGVCLRCGNPGKPTYSSIKSGQGACLYCAGNAVDADQAFGTMVAADFLPTTPFQRVHAPWPGVCLKCGNPGKPSFVNVRAGHRPCLYCARNVVDDAIAYGRMLAVDFLPTTPFPGSTKKWPGVCLVCGHESAPRYRMIQQGGGPCAACAPYGFNPGKAAIVYAVTDGDVVKVGVSNRRDARITEHAKQGLPTVLHVVTFDDGQAALQMERRWIRYIHDHPEYEVPRDRLPNGFTEALYGHEGLLEWIGNLFRTENPLLSA